MRRISLIVISVVAFAACRRGGENRAMPVVEGSGKAKVPESLSGLCHGGFCFEDPLPTGEELVDVVTGGRDDAIIATAGGQALGSSLIRWDGNAFSSVDVTEHVTAMHRVAAGNVWAATREGVLLHGDGRAWKSIDVGVKSALASVWGAGADAIWAVGDDGVIVHWDGAGWSRQSSPAKTHLHVVRGRARDDVWAAGDGVILHYDGKTWRVARHVVPGAREQIVPTGGFCGTPALAATEHNKSLTRVAALTVLAADKVIVAAGRGRILRFDGTHWSEDDLTSKGLLSVNALFGTYAVGNGGIARWDGSKWDLESREPAEQLNGIHGSDENNVWIVGSLGTMLRGKSGKFARVGGVGSGARITGIYVGAEDVLAVGEDDALFRRVSKGWERQASPRIKQNFRSVGGPSDSDVWAFDAFGPALRWNGKAWSEAPMAPGFVPSRVRTAAADEMWAIGSFEAARWNGKTWLRADAHFQLIDVWSPARGKAFATARARDGKGQPIYGSETLLVRWDGASWSKVATIAGNASGIGGVAPNDLWIATMQEILHFDGTALEKVHSDASANGYLGERVVVARGPNDVTVAGYGRAVHFDGHAWKEDEVPLQNAQFAGGPAGVYAFGARGGIVRRKAR